MQVHKSQTGLRWKEASGVFWWSCSLRSFCIHCCTLSWVKALQKFYILFWGSAVMTGNLFHLVFFIRWGSIVLNLFCSQLDVFSLQTAKTFHWNWIVTNAHSFSSPKALSYRFCRLIVPSNVFLIQQTFTVCSTRLHKTLKNILCLTPKSYEFRRSCVYIFFTHFRLTHIQYFQLFTYVRISCI